MNLNSVLRKVNANSNKLFVLLEPHSSFRFQYRLLTMTTFFEIVVYTGRVDKGRPENQRRTLDQLLEIILFSKNNLHAVIQYSICFLAGKEKSQQCS